MGRHTLNKAVIAYTAGLFDGEGCIRYNKTEIAFITSCYPHHLRKIRSLFKMGKVRAMRTTKPNTRTAWRLEMFGREAIAFITYIRPYLLEKAYQADIMIMIKSLPKNSITRQRLIVELSTAKRIEYGPT